eukprot:2018831-Rhodomonas_salina.4
MSFQRWYLWLSNRLVIETFDMWYPEPATGLGPKAALPGQPPDRIPQPGLWPPPLSQPAIPVRAIGLCRVLTMMMMVMRMVMMVMRMMMM